MRRFYAILLTLALALFGTAAQAISYVGSANSQGNTSSITVAKPAGTQSGDLMLAQISVRGGSGVSIGAPAGWTLVARTNSGTDLAQAIYRGTATSAAAATYTWSFNSQRQVAAGISSYRGVGVSNPINAWGGQTGTGTVVTAPGVTTTLPNTHLVGLFSRAHANPFDTVEMDAGPRYLASSGTGNNGVSAAAGDEAHPQIGSTGDRSATASGAPNQPYVAHLLALAPIMVHVTADGSASPPAVEGEVGEPMEFRATATSCEDAFRYYVRWDFGDGTTATAIAATSPCAAEQETTHTFISAGDHEVEFAFVGMSFWETVACAFGSCPLLPSGPANRGVVSVSINPAGGVPQDHFALAHSGQGINCLPEPVTVRAHDSAHNTVTGYLGTVTLSTSTGTGTWTLASGNGAFTPGAPNSGTATYSFVAADAGVATFNLRHAQPASVAIEVSDGSISTLTGAATAAERPELAFAASGFRFVDTAYGNVGTQVAGKSSNVAPGAQALFVQAIRTDTTTGACQGMFEGQTVQVELASQCIDPTTCAGRQVDVNGTAIADNPGSGITAYIPVPLTFGSDGTSRAPITLNYPDVGRIRLHARYALPDSGTPGEFMSGASNEFVVRPHDLVVSDVRRTADSYANPAAADADGAAFIRAGHAFSATVTAVTTGGVAAPNFGRETVAPGLSLTHTLVAPAGGQLPALANAANFGAYAGGATTGVDFRWPEVGIIRLRAELADYLGTGAVQGAQSGTVGRFIPDHLYVEVATAGELENVCDAGGFTYIGQGFGYAAAPVLRAEARALGGAVARNYDGAFMKLAAGGVTLAYPTSDSTQEDAIGALLALDAEAGTALVTALGDGLAEIALGADTYTFERAHGQVEPFVADLSIGLTALVDQDGVAAGDLPLAFTPAGNRHYYGRLRVMNAHGPGIFDLALPVRLERYEEEGFRAHVDDSCTALTITDFTVTPVPDPDQSIPDPTFSGFNLGEGTLDFACSGVHCGPGYAAVETVIGASLPWLLYDWTGSGDAEGAGRATFGIYRGSPRLIHVREVY